MALPRSKTRIVCTIGPASDEPATMRALLLAGMTIARLNFSHGAFDEHAARIRRLREAAEATDRPLAILADLPGPKIRLGELGAEAVEVAAGDAVTLTTEDVLGSARRMSVSLPNLPDVVRPGDTIFLNDGLVQLEVVSREGQDVETRVVAGGELRSRKGLNLPGVDLGRQAFTPRDEECLAFALEHGVDAISQSFVDRAEDVEAVREAARARGATPLVIAKIERAGALERLDAILEAADGIMVARGDLGVEIPIEDIAEAQKRLVRKANLAGKPVITATQMLESMMVSPRPTRAEATDVANAVLDGTDAVMLSGESAVGRYPVLATEMLARIAASIEPRLVAERSSGVLAEIERDAPRGPQDLIALSVETVIERIVPHALIVPTRTGSTARRLARFRLPVWITAVSRERATCQGLLFTWGVAPVLVSERPDDWRAFARDWMARAGIEGHHVVLTEGPSRKHPDANDRMELMDLSAPERPDLS